MPKKHNNITFDLGIWFYVGQASVGAKGNSYSEMVYDGQGSFVSAVKLVHTKGYVSNHQASSGFLGGSTDSMQLGILITDTDNRIIYPSPRITEVSTTGDKGWYKMPGYTKKSRNLVLSDFAAPQYFEKGTKFRVWYGEDLYDYTDLNLSGN